MGNRRGSQWRLIEHEEIFIFRVYLETVTTVLIIKGKERERKKKDLSIPTRSLNYTTQMRQLGKVDLSP